MSDSSFGFWLFIALVIAGIVGVFAWLHASQVDDCRAICRARGTTYLDGASYGCLCADGSIAPFPDSTTFVLTH